MPAVSCPGCSRQILLSLDDMVKTVECARCGIRFRPTASSREAPPVQVKLGPIYPVPAEYSEPSLPAVPSIYSGKDYDAQRRRTNLFMLSFLGVIVLAGVPLLILAIRSAPGPKPKVVNPPQARREEQRPREERFAPEREVVYPRQQQERKDVLPPRREPAEEPPQGHKPGARPPEVGRPREAVDSESQPPVKTPGPKMPPVEDEDPAVTDVKATAEVQALIKRLKGPYSAERIKAAGELAKLGEAAKPAARALCAAAIDKQVRKAALEALEKVQPDLAEPVTTLLVDPRNSHVGSQTIVEMGDAGSPAIPVLIWHAKWGYYALYDMAVLAKIGPTDPEVVRVIIGYARGTIRSAPIEGGRTTLSARTEDLKCMALKMLGQLAANQGNLRREIVAALVKTLTECRGRLKDTGHDNIRTTMTAIEAVGEYGPDAEKAIPLLRDLKLHQAIQIRDAAKAALEKIEKK